jgi:glycosyltransferase involved in cell wall biosynthesis
MNPNKGLRVLFFYQYFGTPKGSWSTRVYELTRRWVDEGHQVTVVTTPYNKSDIIADGFISKLDIEGINVLVVNSGDSNLFPIWKRVIRALTFSLISIYYALRYKYDIAISSSGPITIGLPLIAAKIFRRKKTIFEVRDLWPSGGIELGLIKEGWQSRLALKFERLCYANADQIVTASPGQKKHILNRFPDKEIHVIPNASDVDLFGKSSREHLPSWTKGKRLFTHIGSLGLIHNTTYWLEVAREVKKMDKNDDIIFVFIGDGADREKLEARKDKYQLDNLIFLGLKPKNELPIWVQNSCATLFATTNNPVQDTSSPNKVFDSFAAGIPIVQTSKGWIRELVENENCGINVPLDNPGKAAEAILKLSNNRELLKELGKNALRLANSDFDRNILAKRYLNIITALIEKKDPIRLMYFYQYFGTPKGSWSTRVYELSKRWTEMGVHVTVVTSPYYKSDIEAKKFISMQEIEGINLIVINAADSNKDGFLKRAINAFLFAIMSVYYALTWKYDVIICSSGPLTIGLPGIFAHALRRKKSVFEIRDLWPQGSVELGLLKSKPLIRLAYWFEKRCYKNSDLLIPCSVDMESSVKNRFGDLNTCIIPNASDSSFYITPHESPKTYPEFVRGKEIFLYAGSLGLMDDCMQIVEAAKLLRNQNIAIVFAGDGAEKPELEEAVKKYNLKNVFFTGLLPKTDIIKWFFLSRASLVTFKDLPVLSTNSPNKLFDSFAAGIPVIQTTKGWIKDLVVNENCGLNAEPHDPKSLAVAMEWMIANGSERDEMAKNALRLAKTEFNRDLLAKKYMKSINGILSEELKSAS